MTPIDLIKLTNTEKKTKILPKKDFGKQIKIEGDEPLSSSG